MIYFRAVLISHARDDGSATFHFAGGEHRAVYVAGSFNGWQVGATPMRRGEGGFYADVTGLPPGDVSYKFVADGTWQRDPKNLTTSPDGSGGENSVLPRDGKRGTSYHLRFASPALGEERGYVIHLPPSYAERGRRFPVLYLLHGALDWERTWLERGGLTESLERLNAEGALGDLIVVMPFEPGGLYRGDPRVASYLGRDVVGHIDFEFRTLAAREHRALDGLSTGGFTSLVLGATSPELWSSVGSMSGSYDDRCGRAIEGAARAIRASGQRWLLSCGEQEPHFAACRGMYEELRRNEIDASWAAAPGTHDWPVWRALIGAHLRFHWAQLAP